MGITLGVKWTECASGLFRRVFYARAAHCRLEDQFDRGIDWLGIDAAGRSWPIENEGRAPVTDRENTRANSPCPIRIGPQSLAYASGCE